jgi:hypothetical protein
VDTNAAVDIGNMAKRMATTYYAYTAALQVARSPDAERVIAGTALGRATVGFVHRKDGTMHVFDFSHYREHIQKNMYLTDEFAKVWLVGSLLTVGDALSRHRYFDHAPVLELLYHLRNGVAHGNVFHFTVPGLQRLRRHPAHNRFAHRKGGPNSEFEIVPSLRGQLVLFDYMAAADVLDVLESVGTHLLALGSVGSPQP